MSQEFTEAFKSLDLSGDTNMCDQVADPITTRACAEPELSQAEIEEILKRQDSRLVSSFEATKLEKDAKKNWDIFYKRNETRFFKDRHWTLREFEEILGDTMTSEDNAESKVLLEIGCGVGNFAFPVLEEVKTLEVWACDFSPRAIDLVK